MGFCRRRCRLSRYTPPPNTIATIATTPTTIPAMAPPDRDAEEELGLSVEVVTAVVVLGVDVEVAGINDCGSKAQVVADGASALKEEYVSSSTCPLMFPSGLSSLFQQILSWLSASVHDSLYPPSDCLPSTRASRRKLEQRQTFHKDNTMCDPLCHRTACCCYWRIRKLLTNIYYQDHHCSRNSIASLSQAREHMHSGAGIEDC